MASSSRKNIITSQKLPFPFRRMLSHLPAKSIVRFRCVAISWNVLILSSNFVELHHQVSLSRVPDGTGFIVSFKHGSSKLLIIQTDNDGEPKKHSLSSNIHGAFSQVINGLVCLTGKSPHNHRITVCNIFTHEFLDVPASSSLNATNLEPNFKVIPSYLFGFDHNAGVYKVLDICEIKNPDGVLTSYQFEIFTLGIDHFWRKINPPNYEFSSQFGPHKSYLYVNGALYWIQHNENIKWRFVEVFNMSDEKFNRIRFPPSALEGSCNLIDIHGSLAIAMWPEKKGNSFEVKLWILHKRNNWSVQSLILEGLKGFSHPCPIGTLLTGEFLIMDNMFSSESKLIFYDTKKRIINGFASMANFLPFSKDLVASKKFCRFSHNWIKEAGELNTFRLSITHCAEHVLPLTKRV